MPWSGTGQLMPWHDNEYTKLMGPPFSWEGIWATYATLLLGDDKIMQMNLYASPNIFHKARVDTNILFEFYYSALM